ncbi:MAG: hypothetical protein AB2690_19090 [Candidatus Thiodiazotropha endolucinida]
MNASIVIFLPNMEVQDSNLQLLRYPLEGEGMCISILAHPFSLPHSSVEARRFLRLFAAQYYNTFDR